MSVNSRYRVFFVEIPAGIMPTASNRSESYRILVGKALKDDLTPVNVDLKTIPSGTIFIHPVLYEKINLVAKKFNLSWDATFAGLCLASVSKLQRELEEKISDKKIDDLIVSTDSILQSNRSGQIQYYNELLRGLAQNKVVIAEASTGIGKGRAMIAAAIEVANKGKKPVIVAAPTINVLTQLYNEFQIVCSYSCIARNTSVSIVPGRYEFVDSDKLVDFIADFQNSGDQFDIDQNDIISVSQWINNGAIHKNNSALASSMLAVGLIPAWLTDDLRRITVNFPVDDFVLNSRSSKECESQLLLDTYKNKIIKDTDIIFCTHAMLAIGQKVAISKDNQWNPAILPKPSVIFVDEAHQFEQTASQVNSEGLSLFSLRLRLIRLSKKNDIKLTGTILGKALKKSRELTKICKSLYIDDNSPSVRLDNPQSKEDETNLHLILEFAQNIYKLLKNKALNELEKVEDDRKFFSDLFLSNKSSDTRLSLMFSPSKHYPSFQIGTTNSGKALGHLWKSAEGGSVIASASLYIPNENNSLRVDYLSYVLALPKSRLYEFYPIEASYVYTIPVLHYPSLEKRKNLSPPLISQKKKSLDKFIHNDEIWIYNVAKEIYIGPADSAKGGTLILCTSYQQIRELTRQLIDFGVDIERIISQETGKKFEYFRDRYVDIHRLGYRPLLIALGSAWTGLDLLDRKFADECDAHKDFLLTDLVIVRLPVGLNRSTTMLQRIENRGAYPIINEALLMFKQGLGRLIRRNHVTDRHIWIMDGRLWNRWDGMEKFTASARSLLGKYPLQRTF